MSEDARPSIGLVVEADADARTVQILIDRKLSDTVDWATEELLDSLRVWRGAEPGTTCTLWKKIKSLCREHGVRVHGKFDGRPGAPDARAARRALLLFKRLGMPDVVVLVRDADDQPERLDGLQQAREVFDWPQRIAIGVANPEREAWILAAIDPTEPRWKEPVAELRRRLGFDPTRDPHRLGGHGKREAKSVLRTILAGDTSLELDLLSTVPLPQLEERGRECGLAPFLEEIEGRVSTLLT